MIFDIFKPSLATKLVGLIKASKTRKFQLGHQIHCHVSQRPKNCFGFTASLITNDAYLGDVNGVHHFYYSLDYPNFHQALMALTSEVANASLKAPMMKFYRVFGFGSESNFEYYKQNQKEIADRDGWLEQAIKCDWKSRQYYVREQFEIGSWTIITTEEPEALNLISDEINPIR